MYQPTGADIGRLIDAAEKSLDQLSALDLNYQVSAERARETATSLVAALAAYKGVDPRGIRRKSLERVDSKRTENVDDWSMYPEFRDAGCDTCGATDGRQMVDTGSEMFPHYECFGCIDARSERTNEREMWGSRGRPDVGRVL